MRVAFAETDSTDSSHAPSKSDFQRRNVPAPSSSSSANMSPADAITSLLGSMNSNQLYDLMSHMKVSD